MDSDERRMGGMTGGDGMHRERMTETGKSCVKWEQSRTLRNVKLEGI